MQKRSDVAPAAGARKKVADKPKACAAPAKRARVTPNAHQLPDMVPAGEVFTDVCKKQWKLGKPVGVGGFGRIYSASDNISKTPGDDAAYVIKMEPHGNGPLWTEMHFYHRAAKSDMIEAWKAKKRLKFLGMPKFIGSGSHEYKSIKYRFMVMERFGTDLQKLFELHKRQFSVKTVFTVALKIIDILEYIHSTGYIHADIKGSNLLLGIGKDHENDVYLVDFGLACKYMSDGKHKPFSEDPRKAHDGTIEFTSRDAHIGAHSRRGDLEILAYNMLQWLCGRLPWEDNLRDQQYVTRMKNAYMGDIPSLLKDCFKSQQFPDALKTFLEYVVRLKFEETPDYTLCRKLFTDGLKKHGLSNDGTLDLVISRTPTKRRTRRNTEEEEDIDHENEEVPTKQPRSGIRKPCGLAQTNRLKRSPAKPKTKSSGDAQAKSKKSSTTVTPTTIIGGEIATPAMLQVLQLRQEKLRSQQQKLPKSIRRSPRSNSQSLSDLSHIVIPAVTIAGIRTRQQQRKQRSASQSPVDGRISISPDIF